MKKKSIILVVAVAFLCVCMTLGTVAWLFDTTAPVTNTFTVGNINITLDEAPVDATGTATAGPRVAANTYKAYPGAIFSKDPTVTVKADSEACYVYVCVENNMVIGADTVGLVNIDTANWIAASTSGTKTIYRYKSTVTSTAVDTVLPAVFTNVTVDGNKVTSANIATIENSTIIVTAYAHQVASQTLTDALTGAEAAFDVSATWTRI